jgi:hypothetical protein
MVVREHYASVSTTSGKSDCDALSVMNCTNHNHNINWTLFTLLFTEMPPPTRGGGGEEGGEEGGGGWNLFK